MMAGWEKPGRPAGRERNGELEYGSRKDLLVRSSGTKKDKGAQVQKDTSANTVVERDVTGGVGGLARRCFELRRECLARAHFLDVASDHFSSSQMRN